MSALETFLTQWQRCQSALTDINIGYQPAQFEPVIMTLEQQTLCATDVSAALSELSQHEGWVQFPSAVVRLPAVLTDDQLPLKAEGCADNISWQLSYMQQDQWLLNRIKITPCEASQATHLAQTVHHISTRPKREKLSYQSLWYLDDASDTPTCQCTLAAFTGFKEC